MTHSIDYRTIPARSGTVKRLYQFDHSSIHTFYPH